MYKPRLEKPEKGNKYYIRKQEGGYSPCIQGNPLDSDCNVLSNCVGYAVGRFNEIGGYEKCMYLGSTNAENMVALAKGQCLNISDKPTLGGCMTWEGAGSLAGHVAIVEKINDDGTIVTSESGYGYKAFYTTVRKPPNYETSQSYKFIGCIVNPAVDETPTRTLRRGDTGDDVIWLQKRLIAKGFMRVGEADGDFGVITLGAVLAFQMMNNLEMDGVAGKETKSKLK